MPKKGYKQTDEHRKKGALSRTGLKRSSITRSKMSLAAKGKPKPWFKGKTYEELYGVEEAKGLRKLRINAAIGKTKSNETKRKIGDAHRNKKISDKTRIQTSLSLGGDGNISRLNNQIKPYLVSWRKAVYKRDGYKCQLCGSDEYLEAHHIFPRKQYRQKEKEVENGITLCCLCHNKTKHKEGEWIWLFRIILNTKYGVEIWA